MPSLLHQNVVVFLFQIKTYITHSAITISSRIFCIIKVLKFPTQFECVIEGCRRCIRVVGRGSVRRRREAAAGWGRGQGGGGAGAVSLYVISDLLRFLRWLSPWLVPAAEAGVFEQFSATILTLTSIRKRANIGYLWPCEVVFRTPGNTGSGAPIKGGRGATTLAVRPGASLAKERACSLLSLNER